MAAAAVCVALVASCGSAPKTDVEQSTPAVTGPLWEPTGVGVDSDGTLYVTDFIGGHLFRIDATRSVTVVAGTGVSTQGGGLSGEAVPADQADLHCPADVAFDASGNLLVVDHANNRIRLIDDQGIIRTVIGDGPIGTAIDDGTVGGDGGPARSAQLQEPWCITFDTRGNLFIADRDNHVARRVDVNAVISTVAGNGDRGFSGDGGSATAASMSRPQCVAVDQAGNLFISDSDNHRIREVDLSGTIATVVGTGESGWTGDGGAATIAQLSDPNGLVFDAAGNLYIADDGAHVIRRVDVNGIITTVAGTGVPGLSGDGGPAVAAELNGPSDIALDAAGNLYIADAGNDRIRIVTPNGTIDTYTTGP